jgi:hypothetical protein
MVASMHRRFEALGERLLAAGIAPSPRGAAVIVRRSRCFMRSLLLCLSFAVLSCAAAAPEGETVLVRSADISGIWKIETPDGGQINVGGEDSFGPTEEEFCRIGQKAGDLSVRCLGPHHYTQVGDGEIDDGKLHLAWGSMMLRFVIDAPLYSSVAFEGRFAVKLVGSRHQAPTPVKGAKLSLSFGAPDPDGLKPVLLQAIEEWTHGGLRLPHDAAAIKRNIDGREPTSAKNLLAYGKVIGVVYLGKIETRDETGKRQPFFSVYDIEFENGERLCGVHRRGDGALDGFLCV